MQRVATTNVHRKSRRKSRLIKFQNISFTFHTSLDRKITFHANSKVERKRVKYDKFKSRSERFTFTDDEKKRAKIHRGSSKRRWKSKDTLHGCRLPVYVVCREKRNPVSYAILITFASTAALSGEIAQHSRGRVHR